MYIQSLQQIIIFQVTFGKADEAKAIAKTKRQNEVINGIIKDGITAKELNAKGDAAKNKILKKMGTLKIYKQVSEKEKESDVKHVIEKTKVIISESFSWFELVIAIGIGFIAYYGPEMLLKFQFKMRELEMENEVMQFHTLILMLMKIERINVEMMLEWIERYSNIFREAVSKCVNNFESGGYEALEQLKQDVTFPKFVRIVESLQAAVDQIPIKNAFEELETERSYYQEKRKESNERLIDKKARIGKAIGFAPMVLLFVGYLIVPMVGIGIVSMGEALSTMKGKQKFGKCILCL